MSNATIYDVAGAARVSLATVSRVLNNPEKVKPETRERVLKIIKELGYRPNAIARGLASRKTTTVGIILSDITRASIAEMIGGIVDIAQKYEYAIKLFSMLENANIEEVIRDVLAQQVDGILYLNDELDEKQMFILKKYILENNIPCVLANVIFEDENWPSVCIDYELAGYEITKEMIKRGRKDIFLITTVRNYTVNKKKELGYLKAMDEAGLEANIFRTSGNTEINQQHFATFFKDKKVDAVISVRDSIAISFINVASEHGMTVGEDILVAGFQNTRYAQLSRPTLTCIDTPVYDIGAVSMRLLTKLMGNQEIDAKNIVLPHKIIFRKSL